ncbi:hypothetical protein [Erythrobacter sp. MTPC3]|uniref:hypothetical protein n=1 Tax=Erythrobacter sp. MTPC3 TaxID=3056564 RepID=UPI0036F2D1E4
MVISQQQSLFEPTGEPVLASSIAWITSVIGGSFGLILLTLSVAIIGFLFISGQLPLRFGLRFILGCFVLAGASTISAALFDVPMSEQGIGENPLTEPVLSTDGRVLDQLPDDLNPSASTRRE